MTSERDERRMRRSVIAGGGPDDRRRGGTYRDFAEAEAGATGGRFRAISKTKVTGSAPPEYPRQPPDSPWAGDPVGLEPPFPIDIGPAPITGEPHEVAASLGEVSDGGSPRAVTSPDEERAARGYKHQPDALRPPRRFLQQGGLIVMNETRDQKVERQTRELQRIVWSPRRQSLAKSLFPNHPSASQRAEITRAPQQTTRSIASVIYPNLKAR